MLFLSFSCVPLANQTSKRALDAQGHRWWQHAVFYEIYPRSFADSNNDGIGDLNGIASKLDYLQDLGVDAIWLTPFFPSPQVDFGYDVSDYEAIDPMYGTLADFDALAAAAKKRGIRLILDFVVNHTTQHHNTNNQTKTTATGTYGVMAKDLASPQTTGLQLSVDQPGNSTPRRISTTTTISIPSSQT
jgi:1,4-alpha-glucan branching enzyme